MNETGYVRKTFFQKIKTHSEEILFCALIAVIISAGVFYGRVSHVKSFPGISSYWQPAQSHWEVGVFAHGSYRSWEQAEYPTVLRNGWMRLRSSDGDSMDINPDFIRLVKSPLPTKPAFGQLKEFPE